MLCYVTCFLALMAVTLVRRPATGSSSNSGTTATQDYNQTIDDNVDLDDN